MRILRKLLLYRQFVIKNVTLNVITKEIITLQTVYDVV